MVKSVHSYVAMLTDTTLNFCDGERLLDMCTLEICTLRLFTGLCFCIDMCTRDSLLRSKSVRSDCSLVCIFWGIDMCTLRLFTGRYYYCSYGGVINCENACFTEMFCNGNQFCGGDKRRGRIRDRWAELDSASAFYFRGLLFFMQYADLKKRGQQICT